MSIILDGSNGITTPMYNGTVSANQVTPSVNMKNRIINGAMVIDQRNAGASVTPANGAYTLDRWFYNSSQASKFTIQQNAGSVTPPVGFKNYLGCTVASSVAIGSTDFFALAQNIEGLNVYDLAFGTANAKTVTLSFQVYSSLTGTFGGALQNNGSTRSYPFTYTISSANTWTTVSVTIPGDTSGTWLTTNGTGLAVYIGLGVGTTYSGTAGSWAGTNYLSATGATSVVGTNGATFYITGVMLEVGSSATAYDVRSYGTELALCQRYFIKTNPSNTATQGGWFGAFESTTYMNLMYSFPVTMRSAPTITRGGNSDSFYAAGLTASFTAGTLANSNTSIYQTWQEYGGLSISGTIGVPVAYNGQLSISAEL